MGVMSTRNIPMNVSYLGFSLLYQIVLKVFSEIPWLLWQRSKGVLRISYWDLTVKISFLVPPHAREGCWPLRETWVQQTLLIQIGEKNLVRRSLFSSRFPVLRGL